MINLLKAVLRLIVAWLKKVPTIRQRCLVDLKADSDLYLVDEDVALFASSCELMGMLKGILCGCHRTLKFYAHCDQNQEAYKNSITKDFAGVDFVQQRTPAH